MAIVAVQVADLEIAGIVLKHAGLEFHGGNSVGSIGAGNVSQRYFDLSSRGFLGCGELFAA
jgi:hypothetical protein